jgi:hypothetical protein
MFNVLTVGGKSVSGTWKWDVTGITIAADGWHEFKIFCAGKNASATDYRFGGGLAIIRRTG